MINNAKDLNSDNYIQNVRGLFNSTNNDAKEVYSACYIAIKRRADATKPSKVPVKVSLKDIKSHLKNEDINISNIIKKYLLHKLISIAFITKGHHKNNSMNEPLIYKHISAYKLSTIINKRDKHILSSIIKSYLSK